MKWISCAPALLAILATVAAGPALAQSMRCKNDLANVGDSKTAVQQKCGSPEAKDSFCKPVEKTTVAPSEPGKTTVVQVNACETVDEWTYNPGRGQFMTTLRFEAGRLVAITYGDRVK